MTKEFLAPMGWNRFEQQVQRCISFMPDQTIFDLPMSDGRQLKIRGVCPFHGILKCHNHGNIDLVMGLLLQRQLNLIKSPTVSRAHSRTIQSIQIRRCGISFSSIPVGLVQICFKPSH
jgi:hypothetical protein